MILKRRGLKTSPFLFVLNTTMKNIINQYIWIIAVASAILLVGALTFPDKKNRLEFIEERMNEVEEQRTRIDNLLDKKEYLITGHVEGDKMFDRDEQALPQRFLEVCSLRDIKQCILDMEWSFKTKHGFGYIYDMNIQPISETKVKQYEKLIESGRINTWKKMCEHEEQERLNKQQ